MKTYQKKAKEGEIMMYQEVLDPIADQYNRRFSTLILPKSLSIDPGRGLLTLPCYEGQQFNDLWNESTGGSLLGLDLSLEVPRMISELATIDTAIVTENERLKDIKNLVFDHMAYTSSFRERSKKFLDASILTEERLSKAAELLAEPYSSAMTLSNGDFYPRNFIRTLEDRIVLIDWEPWNSHSPFYIVDYVENVAAVCFVHMWNNPAWQEEYVSALRKLFPMRRNDFQKAVLIKSLRLADFWFDKDGRNELCANQLALFQSALREEYMEQLWK